MPPRSVKMKRRILGFQRRVWWPKWTPASRSSRIETTDIGEIPFLVGAAIAAGGPGWNRRPSTPAPPPRLIHRVGYGKPLHSSGQGRRGHSAAPPRDPAGAAKR